MEKRVKWECGWPKEALERKGGSHAQPAVMKNTVRSSSARAFLTYPLIFSSCSLIYCKPYTCTVYKHIHLTVGNTKPFKGMPYLYTQIHIAYLCGQIFTVL